MSAEPVTASSTRRKLSVTLLVGSILVALVVLAALVSFVWTPFDPVQAVPQDRLQGSSVTHL
ncbi:MAG: ABC transporter permease, partial [Glutamicibacter sp.]